jgi:small conductance mechanosensitive channel
LALVLQLLKKMTRSVFSVDTHHPVPDTEDDEDEPSMVVRTVWQALLVIAGIGFVLELWGVSMTWLLTTAVGQQLLGHIVVIVVTLAAAIFIMQLGNVFFDHLVHPRMTVQGTAREVGRKLRMLAPLIQAVFKIGVGFAAIVVILGQLGVSTGAMLAGLGVVGVAIGLASQSVMKDVINGLFILFEDSLSVGDLVVLDGIRGFVEKITLRAVTIRDLQGIVHLIPNNTIEIVSNETKEFSCHLLDLQVDCDEEVDVVLDVLRQVDEEMRHDPVFADDLLAPADMVGLERFEGDVVVMRVRLTTRPHRHLEVGREYNRRVKNLFDAKGIQLPSPGYKVALRAPSNNHHQPPASPALSQHILLQEQQGS